MQEIAHQLAIPLQTVSLGGMFGYQFSTKAHIRNYQDVAGSDESLFRKFYHQMLSQGVYLAPSMYEAGFVSQAHTMDDIAKTLEAFEGALKAISI